MGMNLVIDWSEELRLNGMLQRIEKVPQKVVNKSAGKGATAVRKAIRPKIPVRTGALKKGIKRDGERSRYKGKKVYDLMFDPAMNDIFQKPIKNPGEFGGQRDHAYYPASMEYGFLTRSKGGGLSYVPGYHFMREGTEESSSEARRAIVHTMTTELEKEWMKK